MKGYIPNKVVVFCGRTQTTPAYGTFTPAFPLSDRVAGNPKSKTLLKARSWSSGIHWYPSGNQRKLAQVQGVEVENTPKKGYRIVDAEQRGEGGRAWKVVSPEGYLVDLREDVFLPILLAKGLPKSGIIPASFQWCQNGSQLRLEQVGSKAHALYTPADEVTKVKAKERAAKPKVVTIRVKDLVVGGVYQFKVFGSNEQRIYLGRARVDGKIKTVWMGVRHNGPSTPQARFDRMWAEQIKHGWDHFGILSTGSKALTRLHGEVVMPDGWRKEKILWCRGDGIRLHGVTLDWL